MSIFSVENFFSEEIPFRSRILASQGEDASEAPLPLLILKPSGLENCLFSPWLAKILPLHRASIKFVYHSPDLRTVGIKKKHP